MSDPTIWNRRSVIDGARAAACVMALLVATPALAEWTVSKDMGSGYVVESSKPGIAPIHASSLDSAQAQADVLNAFEEKQQKRKDRKNK
ncbi:MAG: hypothetical protein R3E48_03555 [Burkholderiaceae bacterium]